MIQDMTIDLRTLQRSSDPAIQREAVDLALELRGKEFPNTQEGRQKLIEAKARVDAIKNKQKSKKLE